jgi:hypothetical protein
MKKLLLSGIVLLMFVPLGGQAQDAVKSDWRKTGDHWARKNSLTFTISTFGFSSYNGWSFPVYNFEYDRTVYRNLSISAIGLYTELKGSYKTDSYEMHENFAFAGVKVNYNLPLVRNLLYLRAGIGGGVGIHKATDILGGGLMYRPPYIALDSFVKPHFMVDMYLVLRATRWLELRFAPLITSPSQFLFGSTFDVPYNKKTYFFGNYQGTLGVSIRF